jgi:ribosome-binding factor A
VVSKLRGERIAERIRDDLSEILLQEVSDPRLGGIFITGAKVDRELAFADIYVSALEGSERSAEVLEALKHAQGFLRRGLAQRIELRTFPRLRFHWDPTAERAARIEDIIIALHHEQEQQIAGAEIDIGEDADGYK